MRPTILVDMVFALAWNGINCVWFNRRFVHVDSALRRLWAAFLDLYLKDSNQIGTFYHLFVLSRIPSLSIHRYTRVHASGYTQRKQVRSPLQ